MKHNYLIASLFCFLVCLAILFYGCMPSKKSNMELGEEVKAPRGYTEMQIRKAVDEAVKNPNE